MSIARNELVVSAEFKHWFSVPSNFLCLCPCDVVPFCTCMIPDPLFFFIVVLLAAFPSRLARLRLFEPSLKKKHRLELVLQFAQSLAKPAITSLVRRLITKQTYSTDKRYLKILIRK